MRIIEDFDPVMIGYYQAFFDLDVRSLRKLVGDPKQVQITYRDKTSSVYDFVWGESVSKQPTIATPFSTKEIVQRVAEEFHKVGKTNLDLEKMKSHYIEVTHYQGALRLEREVIGLVGSLTIHNGFPGFVTLEELAEDQFKALEKIGEAVKRLNWWSQRKLFNSKPETYEGHEFLFTPEFIRRFSIPYEGTPIKPDLSVN